MQPPQPSLPSFAAPRLKVGRAGRHLQELDDTVTAFLALKPYVIMVETWEELPAYVNAHAWRARERQKVPPEISTIIGDIVHNLRAALDLLACDLVRLNGKSAAGVHFPFCETENDLQKSIREKGFHKAGLNAVNILTDLQPYKGGNVALRALHDMDVADKHKALLPAIGAVSLPSMKIRFGGNEAGIPEWATTIEHDGQLVVSMPALSNLPVGTEMPCKLQLVFRTGDTFQGREIVQSLKQLAQLTAGIIDTFETHCQAQETKTV